LDNKNEKILKRKNVSDNLNNLQGNIRKNIRNPFKNDILSDACNSCEQILDTKNTVVCLKKCLECAVREDRYDESGMDGTKYICASCVEYQKPRYLNFFSINLINCNIYIRKKIREQSSERSFIGNKREKREYLERNSSLDKSSSQNNLESKEEERNEFFSTKHLDGRYLIFLNKISSTRS